MAIDTVSSTGLLQSFSLVVSAFFVIGFERLLFVVVSYSDTDTFSRLATVTKELCNDFPLTVKLTAFGCSR